MKIFAEYRHMGGIARKKKDRRKLTEILADCNMGRVLKWYVICTDIKWHTPVKKSSQDLPVTLVNISHKQAWE